MRINLKFLQEEVDNVFGSGVVQVYEVTEATLNTSPFPKEWAFWLSGFSSIKDFMIDRWCSAQKFPKFSSALKEKLNSVFVAYNISTNVYFLLYVFKFGNDIQFFQANESVSDSRIDKRWINYLQHLFLAHNGFTLLDGGIIHICDQSEIVEELNNPDNHGFIKVFQCNTDWVGLGLVDGEIKSFIIWGGDEEIEEIEDIYEEIDDWLAVRISDYDDL